MEIQLHAMKLLKCFESSCTTVYEFIYYHHIFPESRCIIVCPPDLRGRLVPSSDPPTWVPNQGNKTTGEHEGLLPETRYLQVIRVGISMSSDGEVSR